MMNVLLIAELYLNDYFCFQLKKNLLKSKAVQINNHSTTKKMKNLSNMYEQESPVECYKLKYISYYCIVLLVLSLVFNISLLVLLAMYKKLRTTLNMLVTIIVVLNLIGSLCELPVVIASNFSCKYVYKFSCLNFKLKQDFNKTSHWRIEREDMCSSNKNYLNSPLKRQTSFKEYFSIRFN